MRKRFMALSLLLGFGCGSAPVASRARADEEKPVVIRVGGIEDPVTKRCIRGVIQIVDVTSPLPEVRTAITTEQTCAQEEGEPVPDGE
jgi:hypothetical protein